MVERGLKKGLKLPTKSSLTNTEKEILHLISDEFLTIKQIAQRRDCSIQAVYKLIKKLKNKGALDIGLNRVESSKSTHSKNDVRLHGQEFNIRILWQDNKYQELLEKSNTMFIDSNTIRLYKNAIEIYSGQSFYGKTTNISESKSLFYWRGFLAKLEHILNVTLIKPRSRNIKIVNQHYARGDSEIAEDSIKNKERVWVYAEEDGKLCFITDNSFGFKEDELVHPITAKQDRKAVDKQVNDWRLNNPPTNSELLKNQTITQNQLGQLVNVMGDYGKHIKSHTESIKALSKAIPQLVKILKETKKENSQLKQRKLGDWF